MSKNQFTGTATQPQLNRKLCQFNNDLYCIRPETGEGYVHVGSIKKLYALTFIIDKNVIYTVISMKYNMRVLFFLNVK